MDSGSSNIFSSHNNHPVPQQAQQHSQAIQQRNALWNPPQTQEAASDTTQQILVTTVAMGALQLSSGARQAPSPAGNFSNLLDFHATPFIPTVFPDRAGFVDNAPVREERIVRDEHMNIKQPPSIKKQYKEAQALRRLVPRIANQHVIPFSLFGGIRASQ